MDSTGNELSIKGYIVAHAKLAQSGLIYQDLCEKVMYNITAFMDLPFMNPETARDQFTKAIDNIVAHIEDHNLTIGVKKIKVDKIIDTCIDIWMHWKELQQL